MSKPTQCLTPIVLKARPDKFRLDKQGMTDQFPCGKCPPCLRKRQAGWLFRLKQEQLISKNASFITLTYDDEHLPKTEQGIPTLNRKHPQLFIKRLRKIVETYFPQTEKIRYYLCGEYGSITARPHYHAIIFNLPQEYLNHPELLTRDWQMGNTMTCACNDATMTYVTKYIMKTMYHENDKTDPRQKEFSNISKGIGGSYLSKATRSYYKVHLLPYLTVEDGERRTMPRYYKEKLYTEAERKKINKKTEQYMLDNPEFNSEKHRQDYTKNEFVKMEQANKLNRHKI